MEETKSPNKALVGLIVVVLLVAATAAVVVFTSSGDKPKTTSSTQPTSISSPSASTSTTASDASYKDGSYDATGNYQTPGGSESIGVKVTFTNGVITDAEVTQEGRTNEAQEYQAAFASAFKSQVIGKKIGDVSLSRVAGSSLTPNGFNDALSDIESQAQA